MSKQDMNRFFDICRDHRLELAQPLLTMKNSQPGIAVVDDIVIHHTKLLGEPNYDAMRAKRQSMMLRLQLPGGHWRASIESPLRRTLLAQALGRFGRPHRSMDQLPT